MKPFTRLDDDKLSVILKDPRVAPEVRALAREAQAARSRDKRLGQLMTPVRRPRDHGPHSLVGQRGEVLAVCQSGTNELVCENGILVLLMGTGRVVVDSADNWKAC